MVNNMIQLKPHETIVVAVSIVQTENIDTAIEKQREPSTYLYYWSKHNYAERLTRNERDNSLGCVIFT
jgi:hypothetical protein